MLKTLKKIWEEKRMGVASWKVCTTPGKGIAAKKGGTGNKACTSRPLGIKNDDPETTPSDRY
jgi:hypothetical protein